MLTNGGWRSRATSQLQTACISYRSKNQCQVWSFEQTERAVVLVCKVIRWQIAKKHQEDSVYSTENSICIPKDLLMHLFDGVMKKHCDNWYSSFGDSYYLQSLCLENHRTYCSDDGNVNELPDNWKLNSTVIFSDHSKYFILAEIWF